MNGIIKKITLEIQYHNVASGVVVREVAERHQLLGRIRGCGQLSAIVWIDLAPLALDDPLQGEGLSL